MNTFAQIVDGYTQNAVTGDDLAAALKGTFSPAWVESETEAGRPWVTVPNGTQSSAKSNGDGTFTNLPPRPPSPAVLSATAFNQLCALALGGGSSDQQMLAGMAAFQNIMDGARTAGGAAKFVVTQYDKAATFDKSEVATFAAVLTAPGVEVMTPEQAAAILAAWPSTAAP